jgi:hypothetical protein
MNQRKYFLIQNIKTGVFNLMSAQSFYTKHSIVEYSFQQEECLEDICAFMQQYFLDFPNARDIKELDTKNLDAFPDTQAEWNDETFLHLIKCIDFDGYIEYNHATYDSGIIYIFKNKDKYTFTYEEGDDQIYYDFAFDSMLQIIGRATDCVISPIMVDTNSLSENLQFSLSLE